MQTKASSSEKVNELRSANSIRYMSLYLTMVGIISLTILVIIPNAIAVENTIEFELDLPWFSWIFGSIALLGIMGMVISGITLTSARFHDRNSYDEALKR